MNKKFDTISMILIIVLTFILIGFIFNYFTKPDSDEFSPAISNSTIIGSNVVENMSGSNTLIISTPVVDNEKTPENVGEIIEQGVNNSGDKGNVSSGDGIIKDVYTKPPESTSKDVTPVIITSNDNISDKEKKEVLKELDQTLMDLLDVIENVQTVDESRLPSEGSEVQPWESFLYLQC